MSRSISHKIKTAIRLFREATYRYSDSKYPDSFMSKYTSDLPKDVKNVKVDRVIYCFWTGDNEMSENRKRGVQTLRENTGIEVKLITPENLNDYILPEDPLPECYKYLSLVHKADYLRCYFMHYYGGGYSDIKVQYNSWKPFFDRLEQSNDYLLSYPEYCYDIVSLGDDYETRLDLCYYWRLTLGAGAMICRPKTRFTDEWYREMKRRVLEKSEELKLHPATDFRGYNRDYPLDWMHILGDIFHPLSLKYHKWVIKEPAIKPNCNNYL